MKIFFEPAKYVKVYNRNNPDDFYETYLLSLMFHPDGCCYYVSGIECLHHEDYRIVEYNWKTKKEKDVEWWVDGFDFNGKPVGVPLA